MENRNEPRTRVLAVDPNTDGFGYVLFEGPERLIDWGLPQVTGHKNPACLKRIAQLLGDYAPQVLVLENIDAPGCHRCPRVRKLLRAIEALARKRRVRIAHVSRTMLKRVFADVGCHNKDDVAAEIARRHPRLAYRLPPRRKCWMSEDVRMSLFDAAALYLAHIERVRRAA